MSEDSALRYIKYKITQIRTLHNCEITKLALSRQFWDRLKAELQVPNNAEATTLLGIYVVIDEEQAKDLKVHYRKKVHKGITTEYGESQNATRLTPELLHKARRLLINPTTEFSKFIVNSKWDTIIRYGEPLQNTGDENENFE